MNGVFKLLETSVEAAYRACDHVSSAPAASIAAALAAISATQEHRETIAEKQKDLAEKLEAAMPPVPYVIVLDKVESICEETGLKPSDLNGAGGYHVTPVSNLSTWVEQGEKRVFEALGGEVSKEGKSIDLSALETLGTNLGSSGPAGFYIYRSQEESEKNIVRGKNGRVSECLMIRVVPENPLEEPDVEGSNENGSGIGDHYAPGTPLRLAFIAATNPKDPKFIETQAAYEKYVEEETRLAEEGMPQGSAFQSGVKAGKKIFAEVLEQKVREKQKEREERFEREEREREEEDASFEPYDSTTVTTFGGIALKGAEQSKLTEETHDRSESSGEKDSIESNLGNTESSSFSIVDRFRNAASDIYNFVSSFGARS